MSNFKLQAKLTRTISELNAVGHLKFTAKLGPNLGNKTPTQHVLHSPKSTIEDLTSGLIKNNQLAKTDKAYRLKKSSNVGVRTVKINPRKLQKLKVGFGVKKYSETTSRQVVEKVKGLYGSEMVRDWVKLESSPGNKLKEPITVEGITKVGAGLGDLTVNKLKEITTVKGVKKDEPEIRDLPVSKLKEPIIIDEIKKGGADLGDSTVDKLKEIIMRGRVKKDETNLGDLRGDKPKESEKTPFRKTRKGRKIKIRSKYYLANNRYVSTWVSGTEKSGVGF